MDGYAEQFELLSKRRRLVALSILNERNEPMSTEELATEVGVRELGVARDELTDEQRERIRLSFHHVHLPKLTDAGVVEYTPSGDELRLGVDSPDVRRILDVVFDD